MQVYRPLFYYQIANKYFGEQMALIVQLLEQYGKQTINDLNKLVTLQKKYHNNDIPICKRTVQLILMIGIKHQIFIFDKGLVYVNGNSLLGREYIPELLLYQPQIKKIVENALQNGIFSVESLVDDIQMDQTTLYNLVLQMVELDFVTQVNLERDQIKVTQIQQTNTPTKDKKVGKKQKKNDKGEQKLKNQWDETPEKIRKEQIISDDAILRLNWNSILTYLKQQEILRQIEKIYGRGVQQFVSEYLKQRKSSLGEIELNSILNELKLGNLGENMIENSLLLMNLSYQNVLKMTIPKDGFERIQRNLKQNIEFKWLIQKFSPQHGRILQILKERKKLDDIQISDISLLEINDCRNIMQELLKEQFIHAEQQKAENSNKQIQYYLYDQRRVENRLMEHFYKILVNIMQRKEEHLEQLYLGILNQMHLI